MLCRTHLAHRSKGVQGVHEAESSRMQRLRVTARRKKPAGWDRQGAWGGRRTSAATRTGDREAGWAWGGNQDRRQGGRVAGRAWDSREGVGQHGGQTPATRGVACGGGCRKENGRPRRAAGVGEGTARRNREEGGFQWHRADESSARQGGRACARDVGWALIGVQLRSQPQRQPQAAELLCATMIAL